MINKVATTHCSFLRRQIKREDISTNAVSVTKTVLYTILRDVCIVSRDVCIVSNRLTCIDAKLSGATVVVTFYNREPYLLLLASASAALLSTIIPTPDIF
jgi:hypothetical protein